VIKIGRPWIFLLKKHPEKGEIWTEICRYLAQIFGEKSVFFGGFFAVFWRYLWIFMRFLRIFVCF
jgi:hypothetical protein